MSHCTACDRLLSDIEAKRKHERTGEEIGLCDFCLGAVLDIQYIPITDDPHEAGIPEDISEGLSSFGMELLDDPDL